MESKVWPYLGWERGVVGMRFQSGSEHKVQLLVPFLIKIMIMRRLLPFSFHLAA